MPRSIPTPPRRDPAQGGGYSTPHMQAFIGARHLLGLLEPMWFEADRRAMPYRPNEGGWHAAYSHEAMERQALSEAIQVLAGVTIEGAVNLYCLRIFGEEALIAPFERLPVTEKVARALPEGVRDRERVLAELQTIAREVAVARNAFVHPKPSEGVPSVREGRRADLGSARSALRDVLKFVQLLRSADIENGFVFSVMLFPDFAV